MIIRRQVQAGPREATSIAPVDVITQIAYGPDETLFPESVARSRKEKDGERPSILDIYADANNGSVDASPILRDAIDSVLSVGSFFSAGGAELYMPRGIYRCESSIDNLIAGDLNLRITGDGPSTIIQRGADIEAGKGLFDIYGSNLEFSNLTVDGDVLTSLGLQYGVDFMGVGGNDPLADALVLNTSFWVHGGAKRVRFNNVTVRHTGGYSILLDARDADIRDVKVLDSVFENNRPHLFGTSGDDKTYGSWTGGIFYKGDCRASEDKLFAVRDLTISRNAFRRNTGNCVWGHVYGFDTLHSNVKVIDNHFEDCGLDGVLIGGVSGGVVKGNDFRRVGYVCSDDDSPSVPKYLGGVNATALDTSGIVKGVNYIGNTMISINGGCIDLDGYGEGTVSGNTCKMPRSDEPEYDEDSIASLGAVCYGIQTSNSSNSAWGASRVTITGNNLLNLSAGALRLYAARNCSAYGNNIDHPADAVFPPIKVGNIGTGSYQRARGTVVQDNKIDWNPAVIAAAVQEDANGSAFEGEDKNWILGNKLAGNCYEFLKDTNSGSVTQATYTTNAVTTTRIDLMFRREGNIDIPYSSWYKRIGAADEELLMRLYDAPALLNVAANGAAGTGAFSTAGRTVLAISDVMATGHLYGDGFLALTDGTFTYPNDASADVFDDSTGVIRYNSSTKRFEQSVSVSAGNRVWSALGGGTPAAPDRSIQFNNDSAFGGEAVMLYEADVNVRTLSLDASVLGEDVFLMVKESPTQRLWMRWRYSGGPLFHYGEFGCDTGMQWAIGGVLNVITNEIWTAQFYEHTLRLQSGVGGTTFNEFGTLEITGDYDGNQKRMAFGYDATANAGWIQATHYGVTYRPIVLNYLGGSVAIGNTPMSDPLHPILYVRGNNDSPATAGVILENGWFAATDAVNGGFVAFGIAYNMIQAPLGGMYAGLGFTSDQSVYLKAHASTGTVNSPGSGYGALSYKGGNEYRYWNNDTSSWAPLDLLDPTFASVTTSAGGVFQSGATGASIAFQTTNFNFQADGNGNLSLAGQINVTGQYKSGGVEIVSAARIGTLEGLVINGTSYNSLQVPAGGAYVGLGFTTDQALYPKTLASSPNTPGGGYGGFGHRTGSTYWYYNGVAWATVDFAASGGGGVSSLNGQTGALTLVAGTGVTISTLTISIGQSVAVAASPTFANLTSNGVFQSAATGATISFQNTNSRFSVNGNGDISSSGSINVTGASPYKVGGVEIVSASRVGTFVGVAVTGSSFNSLQVPSGGLYTGLGITTDQAVYLLTKGTGSTPNSPSGLYGAIGHRSGSTFWYFNGSTWGQVDFATIGGGVTSLNTQVGALTLLGGVGVTITGLSIAIGQAVGTGSSVTFSSVTTTGVFQSGAAGAAISFQNNSGSFQVNGNGQISGLEVNTSLGYKVGGTVVVNSSRQATFTQVVSSGVVNVSVSGATIAFQTSSGTFQVNGNGQISGLEVNTTSGYKISGSTVINSSSQATFTQVVSTGVVNVAVSGGTIAFQTSSGTFQVNGSGQLSCLEVNTTQGYKVNGTIAINSFNQFVGGGVNCNAGVAGSGFNIFGGVFFGYTGLVNYDKAGGGTGTLQFVGGLIVNSF